MNVTSEVLLCVFGVLAAVLLRIGTSLHPYSGQNKPPMFGDYESQRHWMEITTNLPVTDWYHNTTDNDLQYWGLDYPPLTAYHMYLCGRLAGAINADYVALNRSRGFESEPHKLFMRYSVLIADVIVYVPAIVLFFVYARGNGSVWRARNPKTWQSSVVIILTLLYPGLILVDHGHFQYNCVSLGLTVSAVLGLLNGWNVFASVLFCLALNYKQMSLYHAFPFFFYLLSTCIRPANLRLGVKQLVVLGVTVVGTFAFIWLPFLSHGEAPQVVHRLFPVARGVFEDKVATVWCTLNVLVKFKANVSNDRMMHVCLIATLSAVLPSSVDLFLRPNLRKFVPALVNSSLAFYLFSFHVHEKTILLVALPVLLHFPKDPLVCFWFLVASTFSLLPLCFKDGLFVAFVALTAFYMTSFYISLEHTSKLANPQHKNVWRHNAQSWRTLWDFECDMNPFPYDEYAYLFKHWRNNCDLCKEFLLHLAVVLSLFGYLVLTVLYATVEPPVRFPDLFPLLISVYSCVHFVAFFVYFNVVQMRIPQFDYEDVQTNCD